MKTKNLYAYIFIILVFAFPFRYAMISQTGSNVLNVLCLAITIIGLMIFMASVMTDGKEEN